MVSEEGVTAQTAWYKTMQTSSNAAKELFDNEENLIKSGNSVRLSEEAISNATNTMTFSAKAGQVDAMIAIGQSGNEYYKLSDKQQQFFDTYIGSLSQDAIDKNGLYNETAARTFVNNFIKDIKADKNKVLEAYNDLLSFDVNDSIIAKTVVGNLIIGKELQIYNEDKSIVIDENGLTIDGGYLKIKGTEVGSDGKTISEVIIDLDTAQKLVALAQQAADRAQESADKAQASADKANKATEDLKTETNEIRELAEKGVDHVTTYFYQSDSATELVGGEWTTNSVTWISGKYVWQKVITYYKDGTDNSHTAKAICISGANGQDGKPGENGVKGKGVKSIIPQYAISDSNVLQPHEGWSDKEPAWSEGKYIWTRTLVVYDDNTQETTTPIVSNGLNSALSISTAARKQADSAKSTADSANTTSSEAKSTADNASQTANKASENATNAVEKANTANTNASSLCLTAMQNPAVAYLPYHSNGNECRMFPAKVIISLYLQMQLKITQETTKCNLLRVQLDGETDRDTIMSYTYDTPLNESYQAQYNEIIANTLEIIQGLIAGFMGGSGTTDGSDNTPDTDTSTSESGDSDGENTETTTEDTTAN